MQVPERKKLKNREIKILPNNLLYIKFEINRFKKKKKNHSRFGNPSSTSKKKQNRSEIFGTDRQSLAVVQWGR